MEFLKSLFIIFSIIGFFVTIDFCVFGILFLSDDDDLIVKEPINNRLLKYE